MVGWSLLHFVLVTTANSIAATIVDPDPESQTLTALLAHSLGAASLWVSFRQRWLSLYLTRVESALTAFALGDSSYIWRLTDDFERDTIIEHQLECDFVRQLEQERREIRYVSSFWEVDTCGHFVPVSPPVRHYLSLVDLTPIRQSECPPDAVLVQSPSSPEPTGSANYGRPHSDEIQLAQVQPTSPIGSVDFPSSPKSATDHLPASISPTETYIHDGECVLSTGSESPGSPLLCCPRLRRSRSPRNGCPVSGTLVQDSPSCSHQHIGEPTDCGGGDGRNQGRHWLYHQSNGLGGHCPHVRSCLHDTSTCMCRRLR